MVAPPTLDDFKAQLNISTTTYDNELTTYLAAAQAIIEGRVGPFATTSYTETIATRGNGLNLSHRPLVTVDSLVPLLNTWPSFASTDVQFDPRAGTVWRKDLGTLAGAWVVSYTAGWANNIQANWFLAVLILGQNLWETQRGGSAAVPGMAGDETEPSWGPNSVMPPRVLELLDDSIFYGGIA